MAQRNRFDGLGGAFRHMTGFLTSGELGALACASSAIRRVVVTDNSAWMHAASAWVQADAAAASADAPQRALDAIDELVKADATRLRLAPDATAREKTRLALRRLLHLLSGPADAAAFAEAETIIRSLRPITKAGQPGGADPADDGSISPLQELVETELERLSEDGIQRLRATLRHIDESDLDDEPDQDDEAAGHDSVALHADALAHAHAGSIGSRPSGPAPVWTAAHESLLLALDSDPCRRLQVALVGALWVNRHDRELHAAHAFLAAIARRDLDSAAAILSARKVANDRTRGALPDDMWLDRKSLRRELGWQGSVALRESIRELRRGPVPASLQPYLDRITALLDLHTPSLGEDLSGGWRAIQTLLHGLVEKLEAGGTTRELGQRVAALVAQARPSFQAMEAAGLDARARTDELLARTMQHLPTRRVRRLRNAVVELFNAQHMLRFHADVVHMLERLPILEQLDWYATRMWGEHPAMQGLQKLLGVLGDPDLPLEARMTHAMAALSETEPLLEAMRLTGLSPREEIRSILRLVLVVEHTNEFFPTRAKLAAFHSAIEAVHDASPPQALAPFVDDVWDVLNRSEGKRARTRAIDGVPRELNGAPDRLSAAGPALLTRVREFLSRQELAALAGVNRRFLREQPGTR